MLRKFFSFRSIIATIEPENFNEPTQIHLAFADRIDPGDFHRILLENLSSSTISSYRVGNDEIGWSSSIDSFRTCPINSDVQIVYGDLGISPIQTGAKTTIDQVYSHDLSVNASVMHEKVKFFGKILGSKLKKQQDVFLR